MGLFSSKKKSRIVALFDISSSSIGAAYAQITKDAPVALLYTKRVEVTSTEGGVSSSLLLRTVDDVLRDMRTTGAPLLHRRTGSGSAHAVYATIGAPWQFAQVRLETVIEEKPFVFTEAIFDTAKKHGELPKGMTHGESQILNTTLNGYETLTPIGKKASRAEITVLSTALEEESGKLLRQALGSFSPLHTTHFLSLATVVPATLRRIFPHEKDYVVMRVSGESTELMLVHHGFPLHINTIAYGVNEFAREVRASGIQTFPDAAQAVEPEKHTEAGAKLTEAQKKWANDVVASLRTFMTTHALPRTLFLIADTNAVAFIRQTLDIPEIHALWLSDDPLAIVALESQHFSKLIGKEEAVANDLMLEMLALSLPE